MATAAQVEQLRAANNGIVNLATRDLEGVWASLDLNRPERARNALLRAMPALTVLYGEAAAVIAADWYDELRADQQARRGFRAKMADPVPTAAVQERTRFGAGHLFTDNPDQTLAFLTGALTRYVLQPSRDTIVESAAADPAATGWHRETRPGSCRFCRGLAARGAVYKRATAVFIPHDNCRCVAVPSWDPDAPEVPVAVYRASERMEAMRRRAAAGDESAQRQLEAHRARVRAWLDREFPEG